MKKVRHKVLIICPTNELAAKHGTDGLTINTLFGSTLTSLATTLTVIGRDSGARITVPLNIQKVSTI